jgi:phage FluMu gp28-like protein
MSAPLSSVLLPYQQRWVADTSPVKVVEKSRRVGLTWGEAADSALTAAAEKGQDTWYIGYNQEMAREFIETVAMWARAFHQVAGEIEDAGDVLEEADREAGIQAFRVRFASGHKVVALSSRPSNLRGKQGRVVLDEFAFHPEPGELLKAAMALLIWGGKVLVISTHNGEENPFNELVNDVRAGRKKYSLHRITFDEALEEGLYRRVCQKLGQAWSPEAETAWRQDIVDFYGDGADEELHCIPRSGGGAYIASTLIESRMEAGIPVVRWSQPPSFTELPSRLRELETLNWCETVLAPLLRHLHPNRISYFGEDFGRTGDLTVIWPLQLRPDLVRATPFVIELARIPFEQQRQILFYVVDRLPRFAGGAMDARGNGHYLAEVAMQRYGSRRIQQVMLSTEWYRENMPPYKAAFEDGTVLLPRDAEILNDHRAIRMEKGVARIPENARTHAVGGQQRHGDAAIAGALAYAASRTEVTDYDYTPARAPHRFAERHPEEEDDAPSRFDGRGAY